MSVHFEELKQDQDLIWWKTTEIRKTFAILTKRGAEFEAKKKVVEKEGSMQDWEMQQLWVYDEEMALATAQSEFSKERQDVIQGIKVWAQDCANQKVKDGMKQNLVNSERRQRNKTPEEKKKRKKK